MTKKDFFWAAEGTEGRNGPINSRISWNREKMYHLRVQADTFNYPIYEEFRMSCNNVIYLLCVGPTN